MRTLAGMDSKRKRVDAPLASPDSLLLTADSRDGESLFLGGLLSGGDLQLLLTAPTALDVARRAATDEILRTDSSVIRFGRLACGTQCVLKETEKSVVAEAVFARLLNTIRPRSAPAVRHIRAKAVLIERAEPIRPDRDAINMLVQIVDMLQTLQLTVRFRHGDLHWGNIVRVRVPVYRHKKHSNAFGPTKSIGPVRAPSTPAWFNMRSPWTYKMIDFEMSAIETEIVAYEVPNNMYAPGVKWSTQHDTRTLVTALYEFWWLSAKNHKRTVVERLLPRGNPTGHGQWWPRFCKDIVAYARSQSTAFDATIDLAVNASFRDFIATATCEEVVLDALRTHKKWNVLWGAFPDGWRALIGRQHGRVPFTHMQYQWGVSNDATTIFEPRALMTLCCWYQAICNRQWHVSALSCCAWSDVEFIKACDDAVCV